MRSLLGYIVVLGLLAISITNVFAQDFCLTAPACQVYPTKPGFLIKHIDKCSCLNALSTTCRGCAKLLKDQEETGESNAGFTKHCKNPELCSAYYTCRPIACGSYILLADLTSTLTIYLNLRDWNSVATLYDASGYNGELSTGPRFCSLCTYLTFLKNLASTGGQFDLITSQILDQGELALLFYTFEYSDGIDPDTGLVIPPTSFTISSVATRNGCNNWVFTVEYFVPLELK